MEITNVDTQPGVTPSAYDKLFEISNVPEHNIDTEQPKAEPTNPTEPTKVEPAVDDAAELELPAWLGADVSNLTPAQIEALKPVHGQMVKGLNKAFRKLADTRQAGPQAPAADPVERLADLLQNRLAPQAPAPAQPAGDPEINALLDRIEDEGTKELVSGILTLAETKAKREASRIEQGLQRKALEQMVETEQAEFERAHPDLNTKSEAFNPIEFNNFKTFVRTKEKQFPGATLDELYQMYEHPKLVEMAKANRRVPINPTKAIDMGASVGAKATGGAWSTYERMYDSQNK